MTILRAGALGPIVAVAAVLRLADLPSRGFIFWDEGKFALEGIRMAALLRALGGAHWTETAGKTIGTAKPTHSLLIGIVDLLIGAHDYSSLYLSAVCGVVCVVFVYLIGRAAFDLSVGLLAALFLAVSEYDVIYSRSGLSETDANALFLAGVSVWVLGRTRCGLTTHRLIAGFLLGLAFTTNYRLIVYCAVVVALDLLMGGRSIRGMVLGGLLWLCGLAIAPLLWQTVDLIARSRGVVLFRSEITLRPMYYLQQALYQLHEGRQSGAGFNPFPYLQWYVWREGIGLSILIALGLVVLAVGARGDWGKAWPQRSVLALVFLPYVVYVFAPIIVPRNLDATVPFACMAAAAGVLAIARSLPRPRGATVAAVALACLLAASEIISSWKLTETRSGFALAANLLQAQRARAVVTSEVMRFYLRGNAPHCLVQFAPHEASGLRPDLTGGYMYAVIDQYNREASRYIRQYMPLVARYPLATAGAFGENLVTSENANEDDPNDPNDYVSVYRLEASRLPPGPGNAPPPCDRNAV